MSAAPISPATLRAALVGDVLTALETLASRFFPGLRLPGDFLGQRVTAADTADLLYVLARLHGLSVETVAGQGVRETVTALLRRVDGPATNTFYSYRVAESLRAFGENFADHPLLTGFSRAERDNLAAAVDATEILDPATNTLRDLPNNYWAVLARCEHARGTLGLRPDTKVLTLALERVRGLVSANPHGFFDDSPAGEGRFDIYSADVHLFLEPLWEQLDAKVLRHNLRAHVRLLEAMVQENGASFAWGRSVGALSVCMTVELGAASLRLGLGADPARTLALVDHARQAFGRDWLGVDGLIAAHRHRGVEAYRGPHRLLQMTLDCLGKLLWAAAQLPAADPVDEILIPTGPSFPAVDEWIPFDDRGAGLWTFRNGHLAFQLPLVGGPNADYSPSPHAPGWFENPVDSALVCGLPRVARDGADFSPAAGRSGWRKSRAACAWSTAIFFAPRTRRTAAGCPRGGKRITAWWVTPARSGNAGRAGPGGVRGAPGRGGLDAAGRGDAGPVPRTGAPQGSRGALTNLGAARGTKKGADENASLPSPLARPGSRCRVGPVARPTPRRHPGGRQRQAHHPGRQL